MTQCRFEAASLDGRDEPEGDKELQLKSFYYDNEFYMFEYKTYRDIRLVAAPPESVGKYGGDTDNWMRPRHTGDFSMPAFTPTRTTNLLTSAKTTSPTSPSATSASAWTAYPKAMTMVMGYPGSTDRF